MRAGIETLDMLAEPGTYERLEALSARLAAGLAAAATRRRRPGRRQSRRLDADRLLHRGPRRRLRDRDGRSDTKRYARFFHAMLARGVYLAPSQFEAAFVSTAHDEALVDRTIAAAAEAMREVSRC